MSDLWLGLLVSLVNSIVIAGLGWLRTRLLAALSNRDPRFSWAMLAMLLVGWIAVNTAVICYVIAESRPAWLATSSVVMTSCVLLVLLVRDLSGFWAVGIRGADHSIREGIDYGKALKMCRNRLRFLGIGAAKLTSEVEFERALLRCVDTEPIQLLLCRPTETSLKAAAKKLAKPEDEYQRNVVDSLRRIAELKRKRALNIEVRFHSLNPPIFRLMFIDDSLCLVSYYAMGKGDGSELPQLNIVSAPEVESKTGSFYYPLLRYFEDLWELSEPWDFKEYLRK